MPYPARPRLEPLPEFAGQQGQWLPPGRAARLQAYVAEQYTAGRSLRELSELTDRSFSEVRKILDDAGVPRRGVGAQKVRE